MVFLSRILSGKKIEFRQFTTLLISYIPDIASGKALIVADELSTYVLQ